MAERSRPQAAVEDADWQQRGEPRLTDAAIAALADLALDLVEKSAQTDE